VNRRPVLAWGILNPSADMGWPLSRDGPWMPKVHPANHPLEFLEVEDQNGDVSETECDASIAGPPENKPLTTIRAITFSCALDGTMC
jgi:hypothetical protein